MMDGFFKDPRRRNLAILAGATLVSVILAMLALGYQDRESSSGFTPQYLFPDFGAHAREVAHIRVTSKRGTFDVVFRPYRGWTLPSHNNYPASYPLEQQTVHAFSALMAIEPRTARPNWLHFLDLDAPPKGEGVQITLLDDKDRPLASLIVGKSADINDPTGDTGMFVRKPDSAQSWLAKSPFPFKTAAADWMDKRVMNVDARKIAEADIDPTGAPSYEIRRESPHDMAFTLLDLPKGREISDPGAVDGVAMALASFSFDDARPAKDFDFGDAARLITKTFDGLTVTLETLKQGDDYWTTVSADSAPGKPEAAQEAAEINAHANGWAYKLPATEGQLFMTSLDSLLKPLATPAKK